MGFFANQKRFASIKNTFAGLVRYIILRLQHFLRVRRHFLILVSRRRDLTCTLSCLDAKRRLLTPVSLLEYLSKSHTSNEDDCGITTPKGIKGVEQYLQHRAAVLWNFSGKSRAVTLSENGREFCILGILENIFLSICKNVFLSIIENVFSVCVPPKSWESWQTFRNVRGKRCLKENEVRRR